MPAPDQLDAPPPEAGTTPDPDTGLVPFTCPWAQDGLRRAMDGMVGLGSGVLGYGIGSRHVKFRDAADQAKTVDYWMKMVEFYCGVEALPPAITGRDSAVRIIPRDV
jgi:hypothetical protein